VPLDFAWPLDKVWSGFLLPEYLHEAQCETCEGDGGSPRARELRDRWYGYVPFDLAEMGSTAYTAETPQVRAFAERNIQSAPEYYGRSEAAIVREAERLATLWNSRWSHHLAQEDVDALVEAGRLHDFTHTWTRETRWQPIDPPPTVTAAEVNLWSLSGIGHDAINQWVVVKARCEREGVAQECPECGGHGTRELWSGQRAAAEAWEKFEPPTGEGWQLWETVSEGSPITPPMPTAEALVEYLVTVGDVWSQRRNTRWDREAAERIVKSAWAPSFVVDAAGVHKPEGDA
jgi:hypothetical protein